MARILSLETSTDVCSVALHENGELLNERVVREAQAHAEKLAPSILQLLEASKLRSHDLDAVAVTSGPGSYTGLRIGVSTAKGICFAADLPLISIRTLTALAMQVAEKDDFDGILCPMLDARRMEVYCQLFDKYGREIQPVEAKIIDKHSFEELLATHKLLFFGSGAEKCRPVLTGENVFFAHNVFPVASGMGKLAFEKFQKREFEDLADFKPFYLKDFIAKKAQSFLG